jgi:hypothetical protein
MGWINRFREATDAEPARPEDETIINEAPYARFNVVRSSAEKPTAAGAPQNADIADEVKRRQISLAVRYVATVRAR